MADVSSNNGAINVAAYSAAGHTVLAVKATEGTGYTNPFHRRWCDEAHAHRLTVVHYHFARPHHGDVGGELRNFRAAWRSAWRPGDYLALDLEVNEGGDVRAYASDFLRALDGFRHPIVLYTYRAFADEHHLIGLARRLWLAEYSPPLSNEHHWAKQYTDGANGPAPHHYAGIGDCDGSVLNIGTATVLAARKRLRIGRKR